MSKNKKLQSEEIKSNLKKENLPDKQIIFGAFIEAGRIVQNKITDNFFIKLSSITMIYDSEEDDGCIFYTYKDCCYFVSLSSQEVRKAINSFIFEPETHWEYYGN